MTPSFLIDDLKMGCHLRKKVQVIYFTEVWVILVLKTGRKEKKKQNKVLAASFIESVDVSLEMAATPRN